jgi:hypothetical protein
MQAVSKKWWCSFGYNYVLSIFHAKQREVLAYFSTFALILRFLSCYCFRLGHPERKDVAEDAPIETFSGANLEEAIDVEIVRIVKEKHSVSDGFDDTDALCDGASDDVDEKERVEV